MSCAAADPKNTAVSAEIVARRMVLFPVIIFSSSSSKGEAML